MRHAIGLAAAIFAVAALSGAADARAAESGFYVGGLAGASSFDVKESDLAGFADALAGVGLDVTITDSSLDDSDVGFGAFVGYRFLPWLAMEARYVDLGEATYRASGSIALGEGSAPFDLGLAAKVKGPALSVLGIVPFAERWEVYARAEVLFADTELEATVDVDGDVGAGSESANSTDFGIGAGVALDLGQHWTLRAEYERFLDVGDEADTGEADVDLASLQLLYRF